MVGLIRARTSSEYKSGGGKPRNYKHEYRKFHSSPKAVAERSSRNKARRKLTKLGKVRRGDGRDVHHANRRPTDNRAGNLKAISKRVNRAIK